MYCPNALSKLFARTKNQKRAICGAEVSRAHPACVVLVRDLRPRSRAHHPADCELTLSNLAIVDTALYGIRLLNMILQLHGKSGLLVVSGFLLDC